MSPRFRRLRCRQVSSLLFLFISSIWGAWSYSSEAVGQDAAEQISPLQERWRIIRFGVASGLPSGQVNDVIETADGTPWAATESGLAWYDGYRWNAVLHGNMTLQSPITALYGVLGNAVVFRCGDRVGIVDTNAVRMLPLRAVSSARIIGADTLLVRSNGKWYHVAGSSIRTIPRPWWYGERSQSFFTGGDSRLYVWDWSRMLRIERRRIDVLLDAGNRSLAPFGLSTNGDGGGILLLRAPEDMRGIWEWQGNGRPRKARVHTPRHPLWSALADNGDAIVVFEDGLYTMRRAGNWSSLSPLPDELIGARRMRFRENGDLWVTSTNGLFLCRLSPPRNRIVRWSGEDARNRINDIYRDRQGTVWCATSGGIIRYTPDGRTKAWRSILGRTISVVTGVTEDDNGHIWICSGSDFTGVFEWDGNRWRHHAMEYLGAPVHVHRIHRGEEGRLWFMALAPGNRYESGRNPGVFVFEDGRMRPWEWNEGLPHRRVYAVAEGKDGSLWFGTYNGIGRWRNGVWTHYCDAGVPGDVCVRSIALLDDRVYFGLGRSLQRGIGSIDTDGTVRYYTQPDGLPDDRVWEVEADTAGRIWVATSDGLGCLWDGNWRSFRRDIGLPSNRLWPLHAMGDTLLVGSAAAGWASIDVRTLQRPDPRIDIHPPMIEGDDVVLYWKALAFWGSVAPEEILCRTSLDDGAWSEWTRRSSLRIENAAYGDHVLRVQAKGAHGQYDPTGAITRFTVPPPIFLRWYIFTPLLLLILSVVAVGVLYLRRRREYVRDLYESRERLKSLAEELVHTEERERRRMATFLHDVIGQGMSLAYLKLQRWQKREAPASSDVDDVRWILDHVIQDAHTLTFELCPPIIHDLDLAEAITWQVRQLQRQHDLRLYTAFNGYRVRVSPELHVLVFRAVRELVVNAMKHAQATTIGVEMSCTSERLSICVVDDGVGFPDHLLGDQASMTDAGDCGGFGIQSIRRRLADFSTELEIANRNGHGALACLRVPREEIIELHDQFLSDASCEEEHQSVLPAHDVEKHKQNSESIGSFVHPPQEYQ